jgi:[acyl-carrier-protein] S-malonyltransferase
MKIAVLFPGQGSQYLGMGKEFIEADPDCAHIMREADFLCDYSLGKLCHDGPLEELSRAVHLQPAMTVTNLICWCALGKALGHEIPVSCFAGHSAGEYTALYAAGVVSLEDAMCLISKRASLMEREGQKYPGGMRAVVGLTLTDVEELIAAYDGPGVVALANHNSEQQTVISGDDHALDAVSAIAVERGARVVPLNIRIANHSPLVAGAIPDFTRFLEEVEFRKPEYPIYFNVTAAPEWDAKNIKAMMARQIASRVRWFELVNRMLADGVDTFIEVGPKAVLKGLIKKIVPKGVACTVAQVDSPQTLESCLAQLKRAY